MGRAGITLIDVEKAALQLQGRGKTPTVDGIREILGTGSKSTIAQHLRSWRTQQPVGQSNLPQDLLALVTGLWERLNSQAEQRIIEIENNSEVLLQELKRSLASSQQDYNRVKNRLQEHEELIATERMLSRNLEKELASSQQEYGKLQERYQAISQQLEDYKTENMRLHKLATNIQSNLEHYQNSMQQLRTEQTLAIEKQQIQYQQEISNLQNELSLQCKQAQKWEHQLHQKTIEWQQLEKQFHLMQNSHELVMTQSQKTDRDLAIFQERCESYSKTIHINESEILNKNKLISEMEKQIAVLTEKHNNTQKSLHHSEEQLEKLRHEKLFLIQEKSELVGNLKRLERRVEA